MTGLTTLVLFFGLLAAFLAVIFRGNRGLDVVCILSMLMLAKLSHETAVFLVASTVVIPVTLKTEWARGNRTFTLAALTTLLLAGLAISRHTELILWIGVSYFVLRHLHVVIEWWLRRLDAPTIPDYFRYQFFLPVLVAGPINRFPQFKREMSRRRVTNDSVLIGLERVLLGVASIVIIANWALRRALEMVQASMVSEPLFFQQWVSGCFEWLQIFFSFGGYSAVAIGLARIVGITIEENFNAPWRAADLVDFWRRWHITLSSWVRDYLHGPVSAHFRWPATGAFASMIAMGLWHDFSWYYVGWGLWQGLGIVLTQRLVVSHGRAYTWCLRLSVPIWLTLTKPVVSFFTSLL